MIAAIAWCGIFYSLAGGQPMMINGGTGPVLAFTEILYKMSESMDVPFLTLNACIGIWVCIYMLHGLGSSNRPQSNHLIMYKIYWRDLQLSNRINLHYQCHRKSIQLHYFDMDHKAHDPYEDQDYYSHWASALLSLIVFIGTTQLAFQLRKFKFSPFLPNQTCRNSMTDFAVVISILVWWVHIPSISFCEFSYLILTEWTSFYTGHWLAMQSVKFQSKSSMSQVHSIQPSNVVTRLARRAGQWLLWPRSSILV